MSELERWMPGASPLGGELGGARRRDGFEPSLAMTWAAAVILVLLHLAFVLHAAAAVAWTADELNYLGAGHALWTDFGFVTPAERLHGPLPFLCNHLFVDAGQPLDLDAVRFAARCGMLGFSLLLLASIAGWSHALWGRCGMLLSLTLAALSPALIGYGALVAVDVALAATTTLTLGLTWWHAQRPTLGRAIACGVALGLALATKYLAALFVPFVALAVVRAAWRRGGVRAAARDLGITGLAALLVLHACYGFAAGVFHAGGPLTSDAMQRVAALPGLGHLLALFPEPFVRGIDFQLTAAGAYAGTFCDQIGGHCAYFLVTLGTKTPLLELALILLALGVRVGKVRGLFLTLVLPFVGILVYLSLSRMQLGMRYVIPLVPLLHVFAGRLGRARFFSTRAGGLVLTTMCMLLLFERMLDAPHHLSWFNQTVGRRGGMDLFSDSNCDWQQDKLEGAEVLRKRWPGIEILEHDDAPRFGVLARYVLQRKRPDPQRPGRTYDWLSRFDPIDDYLAAWLVYDVRPEDFRRAIDALDVRAARELVRAFVQGDDLEGAREALAAVGASPERERLARLLDALDAVAAAPDDPARIVAALPGLTELRLFDPAVRIASRLPAEQGGLVAQLRWEAGEMPAVRSLLRAQRAERALSFDERYLLAQCEFWSGEFHAALAELDAPGGPPAEHPLHPHWAALREKAAVESEQFRRLFGR